MAQHYEQRTCVIGGDSMSLYKSHQSYEWRELAEQIFRGPIDLEAIRMCLLSAAELEERSWAAKKPGDSFIVTNGIERGECRFDSYDSQEGAVFTTTHIGRTVTLDDSTQQAQNTADQA